MSKLFRALLLIALLISVIACNAAPASAPALATQPAATLAPTAAPTFAAAANDFDAARAMEHNRALAVTIGTRVSGTEKGAQAADYIAAQFKSYGYAVEKQNFSFEFWEDTGTQIEVTAPELRAMNKPRPIQYSPAGHLSEDLVSVGGVGNENDFARANAKGKIALVQRGTIPFSDKAKNGAGAGALAVIIYNNAPGPFAGTLQNRVNIPAIGISGEDGQTLVGLLQNGAVKIKIESDTRLAQKTGNNVIATKRGTSGKMLLLGGHYDSVEAGPGANDNGSGTAVLLELARVLAQKQFKDTLTFIAFDAEEFGLIGSRHHADNLTERDRAQIAAMLNFDMLGGGRGPLLLGGEGALGQMARDAAKEIGVDARNFALGNNAGSDHQSFTRIGIDAVMFSRDYDLLHTPQDAIGEIRAEWLGEAGRVAVRLVEMLEGK
ncbi:MAG: M20/M25/M40 family metallo-hydrolase [Chloroflexi bacterium]|nr:M20/M25/M40 family metallo-hydrolase [Chloroflexota bacterium]